MLDLNLIKNAKMETVPYEWVYFKDLISLKDREDLIASYPTYSLREETKYADDKSYKFLILPIVLKSEKLPAFNNLNPAWKKLIDKVNSVEYRKTVEQLVNINLQDKPLDISFFAFGENNWVSPHQDKTTKLVSHLLYFNDTWDESWGGHFRILNSANAEDRFKDIPPLADSSILFKRSESSWHMVTPVQKQAENLRLTLQIEFWDNQS